MSPACALIIERPLPKATAIDALQRALARLGQHAESLAMQAAGGA